MNSATGVHLLRQAGSVVAARLPRTWDTSRLLLQALYTPTALVSRDQRRWYASAAHSATVHQDAPSPAEEACLALYFHGTEPQQDFNAGRVTQVPGKGRGLVAGSQLRPGDLVMLARPVAVLHGAQDQMPSPGAFLSHLQSRWPSLSTEQQQQLASMHGATPGSAAAANEAPSTTSMSNSSSPTATSNGSSDTRSGQRPTDPRVDLHAVVSYNAYGDEYEDLPAAGLRRAAPRSHVGLWPGFALLNHSCAPNCVQYVVGSTMTVRAVQDVDAGDELTVSYLGREVLAPRQVRQSVLQHRYGFTCNCERCRTEAEELSPELQQLLQELYDRTRTELAPRFERVAEAVAASAAGQGELGADEDEEDEVEARGEAEGVGEGGVGAGAAAEGKVAGGVSARTVAEVARLRLKEAAAAVAPAGSGAGAAGTGATPSTAAAAAATAAAAAGPRWSRLLSALEPSLEAAARQLHAAIRELQEDDEAEEEATKVQQLMQQQQQQQQQQPSSDPSPQQDGTLPPASPQGAHGRRLSRVQVAQAASYQLLELLHLHAHLLAAAGAGGAGAGGAGGVAAAQAQQGLEACWHVLDAACRGSELQVFQACQLLEAAMHQAKASGAGRGAGGGAGSQPAAAAAAVRLQAHEGVREAAALLGQSLTARYGRLRGQQLARVTQASMVAAREFY